MSLCSFWGNFPDNHDRSKVSNYIMLQWRISIMILLLLVNVCLMCDRRKRGDRGEIETPGNQIIRKLTIERIEELKKMVLEEQHKYK